MNHSTNRGAFIFGTLLLLAFAVLGLIARDAALSVKGLERTVTVKGLSEREVPANIATWPISFQVASNDLDELFASVEANAGTIGEFLSGHGISNDEVVLSPPAVTDLYAQQWGDKQHIKYRYTANATVTVYSTKVDAIRTAMSDVIKLGKQGVVIDGQSAMHQGHELFLFTGLTDLKPEMIEEATRNARAVAQKFAQDSDSSLGKIRSARQGQFSISNRDSTTPHIKTVRVVSTIEYYLAD